MPIVVDEVVITVDVRNEGPGGSGGGGGAQGGGGAPGGGDADRQQIVAECVERVLAILAEREER